MKLASIFSCPEKNENEKRRCSEVRLSGNVRAQSDLKFFSRALRERRDVEECGFHLDRSGMTFTGARQHSLAVEERIGLVPKHDFQLLS